MNRLWVRLAVAYNLIFMFVIIVLSGLVEDQSALNASLLADVDYSPQEVEAVRLLIDNGRLEEIFARRDIEGLGRFTLSVLIAALITGILVTYCLTKPLKTLKEAVQTIGERDLDKRIAIQGTHEIRALSRSFNGMAVVSASVPDTLTHHANETKVGASACPSSSNRNQATAEPEPQ